MTAIWTPPKTWSAGELVTAELLNQQLRDNLDYLKDRPAAWKHFVVSASTTSSSFVLVSTDLIMELVNPNQTGARGTFVIGISGSIKATTADTTFEIVPVKLLTNNTIENTLQQW